MNGIAVPTQHLNDTKMIPIDESAEFSIEEDLQIGLTQGILTLPYREEDAALYWLSVPFDVDVHRWSVRTYTGTIPYSYSPDNHAGVDYQGPLGACVLSIAPGEVYLAGALPNGALAVNTYRRDDALITSVGHLDTVVVITGTRVYRGQIVGTNGSTGTGDHFIPHIHMALYDSDTRDPIHNWPAALDPFMDIVDPVFRYEYYDWTPYGVTWQLASIGSPGFWTVNNQPQFSR